MRLLILASIPIAAQFIDQDLIALFSFEQSKTSVSMASEKHYRLVDSGNLSDNEIQQYKIYGKKIEQNKKTGWNSKQ